MGSVTRRVFLRSSTAGITMVGVLGAMPALARSDAPSMPREPLTNVPPSGPTSNGGPAFLVYINQPSSGSGMIMVGERAIPFTDPAIVRSLQQAMAA
jgi:hypothetical protein